MSEQERPDPPPLPRVLHDDGHLALQLSVTDGIDDLSGATTEGLLVQLRELPRDDSFTLAEDLVSVFKCFRNTMRRFVEDQCTPHRL